ncbi:PGAP1-like protein [Streptoalloteichus tenebrarius]|uniref:PGAP1-like protein n=1 Tax=Streptoalloteichus tenebrarius (strain ATCC 17920 / DSM 40477 / JCM 4838 / CBS 697.72 / NBRC 16177 / NCIMB 11028 / NRRL B-12390 / A12253. 1 / ISP 5477) TaxID=1933 RepID=A0ABT1HXT4_STRSD|nr:hypothetical protein [Streptoalloteichus tenebrarius]MCP2260338.1 PGAP1-like protein [Streptoalloteichus tenebrarius]BFF03090.1 hypothetical protein GCM10020241_47650 [Streptoalloteichus tenebrarius]
MSGHFEVNTELLRRQSTAVAAAAEQLKKVEPVVTGALTNGDMLASAVLSPGSAATAAKALVRALTNAGGLGCAFAGGGLASVVDGIGTVTGNEGLAERIAADALGMRISSVLYDHPELANNDKLNEIVDLLAGDHQAEALLKIKELMDDPNGGGMGTLAPVLPELLALNALLDENPANDAVGWDMLGGREPTVDPVLGISLDWLSGVMDSGPGHAEKIDNSEMVDEMTGRQAGIHDYLSTLDSLGNTGKIAVYQVAGPDGQPRYVVTLPGMSPGNPMMESPQDLGGAMRNAQHPDSSYTKAIQMALDQAGVPRGANMMIVGHSEGGIAAANLAQDPNFNGGKYNVTNVVTVGSPVDNKGLPPGATTQFTTVTNDRDIVPTLDGRGPGSPESVAPGRTEIRGNTHHTTVQDHQGKKIDATDFPNSHSIAAYQHIIDQSGRTDAINQQAAPYTQGRIQKSWTYQLLDEPPKK